MASKLDGDDTVGFDTVKLMIRYQEGFLPQQSAEQLKSLLRAPTQILSHCHIIFVRCFLQKNSNSEKKSLISRKDMEEFDIVNSVRVHSMLLKYPGNGRYYDGLTREASPEFFCRKIGRV